MFGNCLTAATCTVISVYYETIHAAASPSHQAKMGRGAEPLPNIRDVSAVTVAAGPAHSLSTCISHRLLQFKVLRRLHLTSSKMPTHSSFIRLSLCTESPQHIHLRSTCFPSSELWPHLATSSSSVVVWWQPLDNQLHQLFISSYSRRGGKPDVTHILLCRCFVMREPADHFVPLCLYSSLFYLSTLLLSWC